MLKRYVVFAWRDGDARGVLRVRIRRIFLARHRVDFRKRFDGLLAETFRLGADLHNGDCVLFIKGDHTQLRAVVGDGVSLYLICRQFKSVRRLQNLVAFTAQSGAAEIPRILTAELSLLLEGASFTAHQGGGCLRLRGELIMVRGDE